MIIDNPQGDSYIQVFNVTSIGETTCNITGVMYSRLTRRYYACNTTTPKVPVVGKLISKIKEPESNSLYEVKQDDLMVALDTADIDGNVYLVLAEIRGISELTDGSGRLSVAAMIQAVSRINGAAVDIVQTTGQSESAVMSQKAVTDELNKKANSADLATVATSGSYNDLANIPVINQDLSASGFTPVANTYYRHTGATTDTFTQGVIYLYDTAYHKLGDSGGGGGTTLNKYEYTSTTSKDSIKRAMRILNTAKSIVAFDFNGLATTMPSRQTDYRMNVSGFAVENNNQVIYNITLDRVNGQIHSADCKVKLSNEGITITQPTINVNIHIIYYNDVEIT